MLLSLTLSVTAEAEAAEEEATEATKRLKPEVRDVPKLEIICSTIKRSIKPARPGPASQTCESAGGLARSAGKHSSGACVRACLPVVGWLIGWGSYPPSGCL